MPFDDLHAGVRIEVESTGIATVTIEGTGPMNAVDHATHLALNEMWGALAADPRVKVVLVTGEGSVFSAGGDLTEWETTLRQPLDIAATLETTIGLVRNIVAFEKPIVSAINGAAVGAGLAVALLADISVAGENVKLGDGHTRIGLPAGDHAMLVWPLLCGLAKAKLYLLTGEILTGREAERIGLVGRAVPDDQVLTEARRIATVLAEGPQVSLRATKHALNHWLTNAMPTFEYSAAMEVLGMLQPDAVEGFDAFLAKRKPAFGRGL